MERQTIYNETTQNIIDRINEMIAGLKANYEDKLKDYAGNEEAERVLCEQYLQVIKPYNEMLSDILSVAIPRKIVVIKGDKDK